MSNRFRVLVWFLLGVVLGVWFLCEVGLVHADTPFQSIDERTLGLTFRYPSGAFRRIADNNIYAYNHAWSDTTGKGIKSDLEWEFTNDAGVVVGVYQWTNIPPGMYYFRETMGTDSTFSSPQFYRMGFKTAPEASVDSTAIIDASISYADMPADSFVRESGDIKSAVIRSAHIVDGQVLAPDIGTGAVTGMKIAQAAASVGQVLQWTGATWAPGTPTGGDVTDVGVLGGLVVTDSTGVKPKLKIKTAGINATHLATNSVGADEVDEAATITVANLDVTTAATFNALSSTGDASFGNAATDILQTTGDVIVGDAFTVGGLSTIQGSGSLGDNAASDTWTGTAALNWEGRVSLEDSTVVGSDLSMPADSAKSVFRIANGIPEASAAMVKNVTVPDLDLDETFDWDGMKAHYFVICSPQVSSGAIAATSLAHKVEPLAGKLRVTRNAGVGSLVLRCQCWATAQ